jgi:hypothetical protein
VPLKIVYVLTCRVLSLAVLMFRGDLAKDAEVRSWARRGHLVAALGGVRSAEGDLAHVDGDHDELVAAAILPPLIGNSPYCRGAGGLA